MKMTQVAAELLLVALVGACSNNGVDQTALLNTPAATQYSIGGTVSGLSGSSLVLQSNTGEKLTIAQSGTFQFTTKVTSGSTYYVLVSVQPQAPVQTCSIANGVGTIAASNVGNVTVACKAKASQMNSIGGIVVGATGSGLVLQNNGGDNLPISSNGSFTFATPLASNTPYSVSVLSPPLGPYQNCSVSNSPGMTAGRDVGNIVVSCTANFNPTHTISGTVTGLGTNTSIILEDNGRDDLTVANGPFKFQLAIPSGGTYYVTTKNVATGVSYYCAIANANGVVGSTDVANVTVTCTPNANADLQLQVSGLVGNGLSVQNNTGPAIAIAANGTTTIPGALAPGASYSIGVASQPTAPWQTCSIPNGSGTVGNGGTVTVTVTCVINAYAVQATVSGLPSPLTGSLTLTDNGGDQLTISSNGGPVPFKTLIASEQPYAVSVVTQPGNDTSGKSGVVQTDVVCVPSGTSAGTVTNGPVDVTIRCFFQPAGFAYVTNAADNTVDSYLIAAGTGELVPTGTPSATGTSPSAILLDCCGYPLDQISVANQGSNDIYSFLTDPNTGVLTGPPKIAGVNLGLSSPTSFTREPGAVVYVTNETSGVISEFIDTTAPFSPIGSISSGNGTVAGVLAMPVFYNSPPSPSCFNQYYYAANSLDSTLSLFAVDNKTGALSAPTDPKYTPFSTGKTPTSVAAGRYVDSSTSDALYSIYTGNAGDGTISQFSVDCTTGALTPLGKDVSVGPALQALLFQTFPVNTASLGFLYASSSLGVSGYAVSARSSTTSTALFVRYVPFGLIGPAVPGSPASAGTNPGALGGYQQNAAAAVTTTQGSVDVTLTSANAAVVPYMQVSGDGITPGTYVVSVNGTDVKLSAPATATAPATAPVNIGLTAQFVYVLNVGDNTVSTFIINPATGALVSVGNPVPTGKSPSAVLLIQRPNYVSN